MEVDVGCLCSINWEEFQLVGSDEVDRILVALSSVVCVLSPWALCLVNLSCKVASGWIHAVFNASLRGVKDVPQFTTSCLVIIQSYNRIPQRYTHF